MKYWARGSALLVDEDLRGLDHRGDGISSFQVQPFRGSARDCGYELEIADRHYDLGHDVAELDRLDRALELIACAEHGLSPMDR